MNTSAVATWLQFLQMDQYLTDFLDNGYDDLETAKKIGSEDLEAIGVEDQHHKMFLLDAVRVLREQGAAWVYLVEASQSVMTSSTPGPHGMVPGNFLGPQHPLGSGLTGDSGYSCLGDPGDRVSAGSSGIASLPWTDHDASSSGDNSTCSSSKFRTGSGSKMGTPSKTTKCLVEVTPEHHPRLSHHSRYI